MFRAGFGRTDITPELGVRLGGYGIEERPAEEIWDRLHSTAIVIEHDGENAVIINLDWITIEEGLVERIRSMIHQRTGIAKLHITICATHSHSVPNTLNMWGWGDCEDDYVNAVIPEIIRSVELGRDNLQEVEVGFATTESLVGVNRRGLNAKHAPAFLADPNGLFDPTMTVAHFRNRSGGDVGIIVHYGAHGTAMGNNRLVSRDWCGVMKDRIESQFAAPVLFLNGAIGDVGPRINLRSGGGLSAGGGDGVHAVREVGYRAATDAIRALLSIKEWRSDLGLKVLVQDMEIPYAPLLPLEVAEKEVVRLEASKNEWGGSMCEYRYHSAVVEAHRKPLLHGRNFTQTIIMVGPMAIVPMPGEMFSAISLRIRASSPFQYTLCCSVSNGSLCYMPTREARNRGGYEIWVGKAAGAYLLADNIDDVLVEQNVNLLDQLHQA